MKVRQIVTNVVTGLASVKKKRKNFFASQRMRSLTRQKLLQKNNLSAEKENSVSLINH